MKASAVRVFLFCLLATMISATAHAEPLDVDGVWLAANRDGRVNAHVRISDCGDGTPCGALVWFDPAAGEQEFDERNPDRALRRRPLIGARVLWRFERDGDSWRGGRLYNPEDGMSFDCTLRLSGENRLVVTGCLGPLCQTKTWIRVTT